MTMNVTAGLLLFLLGVIVGLWLDDRRSRKGRR